MNASCSIVIYSHERPALLSRAIEYYRGFGCPIIVSDDSREPLNVSGGVKYFHDYGKNFAQRASGAAQAVDTEFCLISPDDDYALPKGLTAILSRLSAKPNMIAAQGLALEYRAISLSTFDVRLKYRNTMMPHIDGSQPVGSAVHRVENLADNFVSFFWSVFRADAYRTVTGGFFAYPELNYGLLDYQLTFSLNLLGPVDVVNAVLLLRDVAPQRYVSEEAKGFRQILSNAPDRRARMDKFLELLAQHGLPDIETIRRHSRIFSDVEDAHEWLRFCLYRLATRSLRAQLSPPAIERLEYNDDRLQVIMDDPIAMGDPDTSMDDIIPILRRIQDNLQPADLFHNRFSVRSPGPRGVRRVLAGLRQRVWSGAT